MTLLQSFDTAFSDAFDVLTGQVGPPTAPVNAFMETHAPGVGDAGNPGDLWLDLSQKPIKTWIWYPIGADPAQWHVMGWFGEAVSMVSSFRLWEACLLLALRNYQVMNAPLGVAGGYDIGAVYVGRIDQDYARLIKGYRAESVPLNQEWPTVDEVAGRMAMSAGVATTVDLARAINAAIEQIFVDVGRTWGVG